MLNVYPVKKINCVSVLEPVNFEYLKKLAGVKVFSVRWVSAKTFRLIS